MQYGGSGCGGLLSRRFGRIILAAAVDYLPPRSAATMRSFIQKTLALAVETGEYTAFRERYYAGYILPGIAMPDARETVPVTLALFSLAWRPEANHLLRGELWP